MRFCLIGSAERRSLLQIIMKTSPIAISFGLVLTALPGSAATLYRLTGGHMDAPAFGYVSVAEKALDNSLTQGFEPHLHNHGGPDGSIINGVRETMDSEFEPGDVTIVVAELSTTTLNSQNYYWLPQDENDAANNGVPFLGIGLEELDPSDWTGSMTITLSGITGPGAFVLWQDGFPNPTIFADSVNDSFTLAAGSHTHFNWGFTEKGIYELEFAISGVHGVDGFQTASGIYTFEVIPEPSALLLGAMGGLALLRRRR
jgi:surface-anchored protein